MSDPDPSKFKLVSVDIAKMLCEATGLVLEEQSRQMVTTSYVSGTMRADVVRGIWVPRWAAIVWQYLPRPQIYTASRVLRQDEEMQNALVAVAVLLDNEESAIVEFLDAHGVLDGSYEPIPRLAQALRKGLMLSSDEDIAQSIYNDDPCDD